VPCPQAWPWTKSHERYRRARRDTQLARIGAVCRSRACVSVGSEKWETRGCRIAAAMCRWMLQAHANYQYFPRCLFLSTCTGTVMAYHPRWLPLPKPRRVSLCLLHLFVTVDSSGVVSSIARLSSRQDRSLQRQSNLQPGGTSQRFAHDDIEYVLQVYSRLPIYLWCIRVHRHV
jgi:hypothetical protein